MSFGPRVEVHPPALVVGQVQVQHVALEARSAVDVGLDRVDRMEVASDVEHHPAVGEAGCVLDLDRGNDPAVAVTGDELAERLHPVEQAGRVRAGDDDGCRIRRDPVRLRRAARADGELDRRFASREPAERPMPRPVRASTSAARSAAASGSPVMRVFCVEPERRAVAAPRSRRGRGRRRGETQWLHSRRRGRIPPGRRRGPSRPRQRSSVADDDSCKDP